MEWLNYHHLLYFWAVARYGSIVRASAELNLAQPTISGQVRRLEFVLGVKLFDRVGRRLVLTEVGRTVYRYADDIFSMGQDLLSTVKGQTSIRPLRLTVGVADALPKVLVQKLLEPAFHLEKPVQLICRENRVVEDFLGELAGHGVDMVLADRPLGPGIEVQAYNHPLGECGTTFLASSTLARACRRGFPRSLEGIPCLLPAQNATVRRSLDQWFESVKARPAVVAEFDDSALMYAFGEEGKGIFPSPTVFEEEFRRRYNVQVVGRVKSVRHQFYAISVDRRIQHPAVKAIVQAARQEIFG
ncbi:MAG TPA: transcriptional activator NhaR [Aggregicoccus sp.]|nr:transcriptional activator NhaR [Aggregicoccus sp.]